MIMALPCDMKDGAIPDDGIAWEISHATEKSKSHAVAYLN